MTTPSPAASAELQYAERIVRALHRDHYSDATQFEPLSGDLMGLLSQIDNMVTGLHALASHKAQEAAPDDECACPQHGTWLHADDILRMVRELDVAMNGEAGAAKRPKLCDIMGQLLERIATPVAAQDAKESAK